MIIDPYDVIIFGIAVEFGNLARRPALCLFHYIGLVLFWRKAQGFQLSFLDRQRDFQKAVMMFKSLNGLAPEYLQSMFKARDSISYSLRDSEGKLVVPRPRTNYLKNSFSYSGAVLWNGLPVGLRQASTLNEFKTGCKTAI